MMGDFTELSNHGHLRRTPYHPDAVTGHRPGAVTGHRPGVLPGYHPDAYAGISSRYLGTSHLRPPAPDRWGRCTVKVQVSTFNFTRGLNTYDNFVGEGFVEKF